MKTIFIEKCPLCGGKHKYNLYVERSYVVKFMNTSDLNEKKNPVKVTRIFVCPTKKNEFQGTITLYESEYNRIKSVNIVEIEDD